MSDMHDLAMQIRYDLTAAQGKLTELIRMIGELPDHQREATELVCPNTTCHLKFKGPLTLAEHLYTSHGGPEPAHWLNLEIRIHEPQGDHPA